MDWQREFKKKLVNPEEAVNVVKSDDRVVIATPEPKDLCLALVARTGDISNVRIFNPGPGLDLPWYGPGWEDSFAITSGYSLPLVRDAIEKKLCDYAVGTIFWTQAAWEEEDIDVLMVGLSTPDRHGYCSFGSSIWHKKDMIEKAKVVLAEADPNLIRTFGENYVHLSQVDYFVEHTSSGAVPGSRDLLGRKSFSGPSKTDEVIVNNIGSVIRDGDTIQIGVGAVTEYLSQSSIIREKNDLGFHSEAIPRGTVTLAMDGIINGKYKTLHRDKVVVTMGGGGTKEEMDFMQMNPMFELYRGRYVTDPCVISRHDNMVAINSAISIDLTGQIAAESIGHRMISGTGGQQAFAIGANLSKGGRSVTALPSTAQNGRVSRIVPSLKPGTAVTVTRNLADVIVTEYGLARLRGKTQRGRAEALIAIAHPDFRDELSQAARKLFWPE